MLTKIYSNKATVVFFYCYYRLESLFDYLYCCQSNNLIQMPVNFNEILKYIHFDLTLQGTFEILFRVWCPGLLGTRHRLIFCPWQYGENYLRVLWVITVDSLNFTGPSMPVGPGLSRLYSLWSGPESTLYSLVSN